MPVPQRLNRSLQRALGAEAAEDLVNLLDGVELHRSELRAFRESMRADFAELRGELGRQAATLRLDMTASQAALRQDVMTSVSALRQDVMTSVSALRQEMTASHAALGERIETVKSELTKWSLVFWTGAVLAIAGLVIALR